MDIRELENALRTILGNNPPQFALASLAAHEEGSTHLSSEFVAAAKTLTERLQKAGNSGILKLDARVW